MIILNLKDYVKTDKMNIRKMGVSKCLRSRIILRVIWYVFL